MRNIIFLLFFFLVSLKFQVECKKKDYYKILGVPKTADEKEIKKAFKKLSVKYHPDKVNTNNKKAAESRYASIVEAYETLKDKEKRHEYDHGGPENMFGGGGTGFDNFDFGNFGNFGGPNGGQRRKKGENGFNFNQNEFFGNFNFFNNFGGGGGGAEDFGDFFGGGGGGGQKKKRSQKASPRKKSQNKWSPIIKQLNSKELPSLKSSRHFWFVYFYESESETKHEKWNNLANVISPHAKFGVFDCSEVKEICSSFHKTQSNTFLYMKRNDTTRFLDDEIDGENMREFVESSIPSAFYFLHMESLSKFLALHGTKVIYLTEQKDIPLEIRIFTWKAKDQMKFGFVQYAHEQDDVLEFLGVSRLPSLVFFESGVKKIHSVQTLHLPEIFELLKAFQKESRKNTLDPERSKSCLKLCLLLFNQRSESVADIKEEVSSLNIPVFLASKEHEKILRDIAVHEDFTAIFVKRGQRIAIMKGKTRAQNKIIAFVNEVMNGDYKFIALGNSVPSILFPSHKKEDL